MKNTVIVALLCTAIFASCKKESQETPEAEKSEPQKVDSIPATKETTADVTKQCYKFVQKKDTITLSFEQNGADANGNLRFKNYEKDSSNGPVEGGFSGDTLKLSYTFQSEGSTSVRDVYFLKNAKTLTMGTGDMKEEKGKQVFANPGKIKYDKSIVLVKTECE